MLNVLLISPGFPKDEADTSCIPPLYLLVQALAAQSASVVVISLEYPYSAKPYLWRGIRVYPCGGANKKHLKWRTWLRATRIAAGLMRTEQIHCVHSFWLGAAWYLGHTIAAKAGVPHSTTLMGQDVLAEINGKWLRRLPLRDTTRYIGLSDFHAAAWFATTARSFDALIPWGLEADLFAMRTEPKHTEDGGLRMLGVGSLLPVKNWAKWLQVVALVVQKAPNSQALLIGEGPERANLEAMIAALQIAHCVELAGHQPREAVIKAVCNSTVLLHTADFESYGYVLAEAAACACRVVSTPVGIAPSLAICANEITALADAVLYVSPKSDVQVWKIEDTAAAYLRFWAAALETTLS